MSEDKKQAKPVKPPRVDTALVYPDGRCRCPRPGEDPLYLAYHDEESGVPEWDYRALFEKLILDGFQAGLSWITVLRKRDAFRLAFDGFEPEKIVRYDEAKIEALMQNPGIVRNRAKIWAAASLARFGRLGRVRTQQQFRVGGHKLSVRFWRYRAATSREQNFRSIAAAPNRRCAAPISPRPPLPFRQ
jgi:DNA-3-methyladenine glycosylase I